MSYDVAAIACERVGLPLAVHGLRSMGIENDPERLEAVRGAPDAVRGRAVEAAQAGPIVPTRCKP